MAAISAATCVTPAPNARWRSDDRIGVARRPGAQPRANFQIRPQPALMLYGNLWNSSKSGAEPPAARMQAVTAATKAATHSRCATLHTFAHGQPTETETASRGGDTQEHRIISPARHARIGLAAIRRMANRARRSSPRPASRRALQLPLNPWRAKPSPSAPGRCAASGRSRAVPPPQRRTTSSTAVTNRGLRESLVVPQTRK